MNETALVVLGVVLVLAYPILAIWSIATTIFREATTPDFIQAFAGVGLGVLVGAFGFWVSKLTEQ